MQKKKSYMHIPFYIWNQEYIRATSLISRNERKKIKQLLYYTSQNSIYITK